MIGLLLLLFACCGALAAQEPAGIQVRLYPDESVHRIWQEVVACAGEARDTTRTLERVVFLLRDSTYTNGLLNRGEWVAPDTVFLTVGLENEGWIVAHELMHYTLNGPPGPASGRAARDPEHEPLEAFIRCRIFEYQQHSGGLMGGTRIPTYTPVTFAGRP